MITENRRRRMSLLGASLILSLGLGVTFAATTDSTDTGKLEVQSNAVDASGIDVRISAVPDADNPAGTGADGDACSTYADTDFVQDQTTDVITLADADPGDQTEMFFCLKNFGEETAVFNSVTVENLVSAELGCTNDEATDDPDGAGCGTAGELLPHVSANIAIANDGACNPLLGGPAVVAEFGPQSGEVAMAEGAVDTLSKNIPAGDTRCIRARVFYRNNGTAAQQNGAQTDSLSWNYEFDYVQA